MTEHNPNLSNSPKSSIKTETAINTSTQAKMAQTMAIRQPLTIYTGSDRSYHSQGHTEEWYNDRGGMQYSYTPSDSEEDNRTEVQDYLSYDDKTHSTVSGNAQEQLGEATYASTDAPYVYRPWPQTSTDEQQTEEYEETEDNDDTTTAEADCQNPYQTFYDLSYYGYGDYDFAQLSRTTTTYSVPETRTQEEVDEGYAEDEEEEEDEDDLNMADRRWHCPRPER
ncbi:hypothetical protein SEUCBS139899_006245 [Sporothrix eucalyptigena]|uniref:Uncharacterized protein n=1 Tax=Sporothrix eucalyptigena TaxID=1812306 RepID=A0ABP0ASH5_9PEZI